MRAISIVLPSFAVAAAIAIGACHGDGNGPTSAPGGFDLSSLQSCAAGTAIFTALPIAPSQISGWVPLGNLNPPAHTFPTDHQYIYLTGFSAGTVQPVPLYAPGDVTILSAKVTRYVPPGLVPEDYAVTFAPCAQVSAEFGHVRTIEPALLAQIGPMDQSCQSYSPNPGLNVTQCYSKAVKVAVKSGAVIGTSAGLDLSLFDSRIPALTFANAARWQANPNGIDRFHTVPMSDYYAEPAKSVVQALLGSYDGKVKRTVPPVGGTIASDVVGTLQGAWFNPAQPTFPESPHLAIVPFNVDPSRIHLSMGISQPGFLSNEYYVSTASGANVNRHPAQVTPGAQIWCYEFENQYGIALLQLSDATTLKFEGRNGQQRTCATEQPWAFTAGAITFRR
jgi:hypothetical protein